MGLPEMAITDGVNTVTLAGAGTDGYRLLKSGPFTTPAARARDDKAAGVDGGESDVDYDNPAETVYAYLIGGSSAVRACVQNLARLFDHARNYKKPGVLPVYVKFRPDSAEAWYRSQLLSGRALYSKEALNSDMLAGEFELALIFTRRFFWENDTESEIKLMASGDVAPGATGGKTITNHDDAAHHNYLQIANGQIVGDVPPLCRLEMTNTSGGALGKLFVSHELELLGINIQSVYEGESATPLSNQADANSSNGNFNRLSWAGAAETDIATWTISATENARIRGRWLRVLARFANTFAYTDLYLRVKLLSGGVTIYQSEKQLMTAVSSLQEVGAVPIPPRLGDGAVGALSLVLQATRLSGVSPVVDLDYLMLMPLTGWRKLSALGAGLAVSSLYADDGMTGFLYSSTAGVKALDVAGEGAAIKLAVDSGLYQRFRFLMQRAALTAPIADTLTVRAYYRDRRLTI